MDTRELNVCKGQARNMAWSLATAGQTARTDINVVIADYISILLRIEPLVIHHASQSKPFNQSLIDDLDKAYKEVLKNDGN